MIVKAVKLYSDGYMLQPFAFGGEEGPEAFDPGVRYRSSLQNFVIDNGEEVILVDTGMPKEVPQAVPDATTPIFMGVKGDDYVTALKKAGYTPEQVSKIIITHKHADHTGELRNFPNAKIYASVEECEAKELRIWPNLSPVAFCSQGYENFPSAQRIAEGVWMIEARGHTTGNSIVVAEGDGVYYLIHGDVTYCDEALYANKLSVVYEDLPAARETLDRIREFIRKHPTIYCSTHTPLGYENLEKMAVCDLDNPPEVIPPTEVAAVEATGKYICSVCGYVYDPAEHDGVAFEDLPEEWTCPRCRQGKDKFNKA